MAAAEGWDWGWAEAGSAAAEATDSGWEVAVDWGGAEADSAQAAATGSDSAGAEVWGSAASCLVHCLSGEPSYYQFTVNGQTMSTALNAWFFDGTPTSVVSPCVGWACIEACGVTSTSLPCNIGTSGCSPVSLPTDQSASSDTGSSPGGCASGWRPWSRPRSPTGRMCTPPSQQPRRSVRGSSRDSEVIHRVAHPILAPSRLVEGRLASAGCIVGGGVPSLLARLARRVQELAWPHCEHSRLRAGAARRLDWSAGRWVRTR